MNPLALKLIRITAFALLGFIAAKIFVKYCRKRNRFVSLSDPEIILIAVFVGAVLSGLLLFVLKRFLV